MYYISGLQGRYYIPVMLIPLLCLMKENSVGQADWSTGRRVEKSTEGGNDAASAVSEAKGASSILMWYCLVHVVFLLNIVMVVFPAAMKV